MKSPNDRVTVSVTVSTDPATAFEIFTVETNLWWRYGPRYRIGGRNPGVIRFEPRLGGNLIQEFESPSGPKSFTSGTITAWQPPSRFEFEWRGVNFASGEKTLVEVLFEAVPTGTRVTVHHSGWAAIRPDHPVRHGREGAAFIGNMGLWWAGLMTSLREIVSGRENT